MNDDIIQRARAVPITDILAIKRTYRRQAIRCPFHSDRSPSFVIYPDNSYHCFGCGKHGKNAIDFVMELGSSFAESVEYLKGYLSTQ